MIYHGDPSDALHSWSLHSGPVPEHREQMEWGARAPLRFSPEDLTNPQRDPENRPRPTGVLPCPITSDKRVPFLQSKKANILL